MLGLIALISHPLWFIIMTGFCFFGWGEIFSLFPSIVGDLFGKKWATTNYGIVYTAKGTASIFAGPVAAMASVKTGSWMSIFWVMIGCNFVAALLALFWLKPVAITTIERANEDAESKRTPKRWPRPLEPVRNLTRLLAVCRIVGRQVVLGALKEHEGLPFPIFIRGVQQGIASF